MAVDVLIKQKLFGGKTMPLEVILGEHLQYEKPRFWHKEE